MPFLEPLLCIHYSFVFPRIFFSLNKCVIENIYIISLFYVYGNRDPMIVFVVDYKDIKGKNQKK